MKTILFITALTFGYGVLSLKAQLPEANLQFSFPLNICHHQHTKTDYYLPINTCRVIATVYCSHIYNAEPRTVDVYIYSDNELIEVISKVPFDAVTLTDPVISTTMILAKFPQPLNFCGGQTGSKIQLAFCTHN